LEQKVEVILTAHPTKVNQIQRWTKSWTIMFRSIKNLWI